jgi:hypothetical protein
MLNRHPVDELADTRAEIKRLQNRPFPLYGQAGANAHGRASSSSVAATISSPPASGPDLAQH